jgi:hypothetical protein
MVTEVDNLDANLECWIIFHNHKGG